MQVEQGGREGVVLWRMLWRAQGNTRSYLVGPTGRWAGLWHLTDKRFGSSSAIGSL